MSLRTRIGRKVLGTLISAAVAFSIIPSMVFADGTDGIVEVPINITSTISANSSKDFDNAINIATGGSSISVNGSTKRFNTAINTSRTSTFSVLSGGTYDDGVITSIVISGVNNTNINTNSYGSGWSLNNGTLTWSGNEASSVDLTVRGAWAFSNDFYMSFSSITVSVKVPAESIAITDSTSATSGYTYVNVPITLTGALQPDNTTFDTNISSWTVEPSEGITLTGEATTATATPAAAGTYTITAAMEALELTGTYELNVYEHVSGATMVTPSKTVLINGTAALTAEPTNVDNVRADDYTITWSSADESIATVDAESGIVTGVAGGTVTITATIKDNGIEPATTFTATSTVTVLPQLNGISLDPNSLTLATDSEPATVTIVYDPSVHGDILDTPVYTSSDVNVITVDATGNVTVVGEGTATITVSVNDITKDEVFTAECAVSVLPHLAGITLDSESLELTVGDDGATLTVVYDPEISFDELSEPTFKSSDETVATVSETGAVTAVGAGSATITATVHDNTLDTDFTAECAVTVNAHLTGITLDPATLELTVGDEDTTLTVVYSPEVYTDELSDPAFSSSDKAVVTVGEDGTVTVVGEGSATITATVHDNTLDTDFTAECAVTVEPAPEPVPETTVEIHRLYNPNSGEHFYTPSTAEAENLVSLGWRDEGIGWIAPVESDAPVYRLYNPNAGEHHYTMSVAERDNLVSLGWNDEGIGFYSDVEQAVPVYRQYNPNEFANNHNYTASEGERDNLISLGWRDEGIAWYGASPLV